MAKPAFVTRLIPPLPYNQPMFRLFRYVICLLSLAALSLQGFAAVSAAWPKHAAVAMKQSATSSSGVAADPAAGMDMAASAAPSDGGGGSDCPPYSGCGGMMSGHCLSTPGCNPLFFSVLGAPPLLLDLLKAASPALARSPHRARFVTGAPERPPRQIA